MKINELTKFAIMLFLLPWIPAFILYKHSYELCAFYLLIVFILLSLISLVFKGFARRFKNILNIIGNFLGKYTAIIVLAVGYFVSVVPTGLIMKIVKRDRLRLKKQNLATYWLNYENSNTDYENQF